MAIGWHWHVDERHAVHRLLIGHEHFGDALLVGQPGDDLLKLRVLGLDLVQPPLGRVVGRVPIQAPGPDDDQDQHPGELGDGAEHGLLMVIGRNRSRD
jgi:hypothetical protein